jgi:HlyD family secretion protein
MNMQMFPSPGARVPSLGSELLVPRERTLDTGGREVRFGLSVLGVFFAGFLGWAAFAPLDAAAHADGKLVVSGQRQSVQHRDGGVVEAIAVKEGQQVRRGDILVRLAAADVLAQERALTAQAIALLAQRARLRAEHGGYGRVEMPGELAAMQARDAPAIAEAMALQQQQLDARRAVLASQQGILQQQSSQAATEASGFGNQFAAASAQQKLVRDELSDLYPVYEKGFVAGNRIRALQRAEAALAGDQARLQAGAATAREAQGEARLRILSVEREHLDRLAAELRQVEAQINEVMPRLKAAQDRLQRTAIRAPATGTVVGLNVFTEGGVIAPGQRLMDVVPANAAMRIEARVSPSDADDLLLGQEVLVRFHTLHERSVPILKGKLTRVSADSFVDERTGTPYFTVEAVVPDDQLAVLRSHVHRDLALRAGTPVQLQVKLRERTALQYAFEPLTSVFWRSLGEQ